MNGFTVGIILFILVGETFFRDLFHEIWLWLGAAFVVFIAIFHISENIKDKKRRKSKGL